MNKKLKQLKSKPFLFFIFPLNFPINRASKHFVTCENFNSILLNKWASRNESFTNKRQVIELIRNVTNLPTNLAHHQSYSICFRY